MSPPEIALWQYLRQRPDGLKFRKQHPIGNDIVIDFCCVSKKLVIEVNGLVHDTGYAPARDRLREANIEDYGFRIFRVTASEVLQNTAECVNSILVFADSPHHHPADGPPPRFGEV